MAVYGLGELPDRFTLEKLAKKNKWHPYESVAAWYLWKSLDSPPEGRHEILN
jgi:3-methyladenine DNA glycosylase/8-oxoguanine DNA glycosylase